MPVDQTLQRTATARPLGEPTRLGIFSRVLRELAASGFAAARRPLVSSALALARTISISSPATSISL